MGNYYARFGGGRMEKEWSGYLASRLPYGNEPWRAEQIEESVEYWQRLVDADPCREEVHYYLMRCYLRQGRRGLALRQYQLCAEALRQELGAIPGTAIQHLYSRLMGLSRSN